MAVTIDAIQLNIKQGSDTASSSLDRLAASITNLKGAAKGGVGGLGTLSKQLTTFSSALASVNGLNKIGNIITSLSQLNSMQKPTGFASTMNQLKKLPEIAKNMKSLDMRSFYKQISQLTRIMKPLATEMQQIGNGFGMLSARMQRVLTTNARLTSSNQKLNASYKTTGMSIRNFGMRMLSVMASMRMVVSGIDSLIQKSNAYQENLNLFTVSMGEYTDKALAYAEAVNKGMGIDVSEWIRYQAVFQNMTEGFGIASDKAEIMSRNLTQMGYDLGSVFNVNFDTAMEKLESAISGQPRPMREWGFDLSEASLKAVALSQGIEKNVESMTQMEKAQLRYIYLWQNMEKLGLSGDFARTIEAPANSLRVLSNQLGILAREAGNVLIPALNAILPYLIAIAQVAGEAFRALAKLFGFEVTEIDYSGLAQADVGAIGDEFDDVSDSVGKTGKAVDKLKGKLAGFDQINLITSKTSSGGGGGGGGGASVGGSPMNLDLPDNSTWLDDKLSDKINGIKDAMKDWLPIIELIGFTLLAVLGAAAIAKLLNNITHLGAGGLTGFQKVGAGIAGFLATFLTSTIAVYTNALEVFRGTKSASDGVRDALLLIIPVTVVVGAALTAMLGPIGWVIAGVGAVVGILVGYTMAVQQYAEECYNASTEGQLMNDIIEECGEISQQAKSDIDNLKSGVQALDDDTAKWMGVQQLVDEIYELSNKADKSEYEMALMEAKVNTLNGMNLDGLQLTIDETTGKIVEEKEAIDEVIKNLERESRQAALQKVLQEAYEASYREILNYEKATNDLTVAAEANADAQNNLNDVTGQVRAKFADATGQFILGEDALQSLMGTASNFSPELKEMYVRIDKTKESMDAAEQATRDSAEAYEFANDCISRYGDELAHSVDDVDYFENQNSTKLGSVSKLAEGLGTDTVDGVVKGIKESAGVAVEESKNMGQGILDGFAGILGINSPSKKFEEMGKYSIQGFNQGLTKNTPLINTAMNTLTQNIQRKSSTLIKEQTFVDIGKKIITSICTGISNSSNTLLTALGTLGSKMGEKMKSILQNKSISDLGTKIIANISLGLTNNSSSFMTSVSNFTKKIFSTMTDKINADTSVSNAFKRFFNKSLDLLQGFINRIRTAVNDLMRKWAVNMNSAYYNKSTGKMTTNNISYISIPHFASGGFVENGQLFLARESGAEMVGSVGNKTAVANNDQIVNGIANGVMDAIISTGIVGNIQSIDKSARETASGSNTPVFAPSADAGRWIARSLNMYRKVGGTV